MVIIAEDLTREMDSVEVKSVETPTGYKLTELGLIPEDWRLKRLWEITTEIGDGIHATPRYVDSSDYYFVNGNNLNNGKIVITNNTKFVGEGEFNLLKKNLNNHTILMSINGTIGELAYFNNENVILGKSVAYVNLKKHVEKIFIYYFFQTPSVKKYYINELTGTTIKNLSLKSIRETPITYPSLKEQQAIAAALSDIDALITSFDQLITKKQAIKQAAIQQLLTGKQRLPGFNDEWKSKRIGEIFQFLSTANNPRSDLSEHGDIRYLHYGDIHGGTSPFLDCSKKTMPYIELQKIKNFHFLEEGDLVIADASEDYEGIGKSVEILNINNKKIVAGLHTFLLRGNKSIVADGFKGYIQSIPSLRTDIVRLATGISVYGISKNNLRGVEVKLPPIQEQKAIANVLSDMNSEITALELQLDKARNLKQGMMQELLTGRIRLT